MQNGLSEEVEGSVWAINIFLLQQYSHLMTAVEVARQLHENSNQLDQPDLDV